MQWFHQPYEERELFVPYGYCHRLRPDFSVSQLFLLVGFLHFLEADNGRVSEHRHSVALSLEELDGGQLVLGEGRGRCYVL